MLARPGGAGNHLGVTLPDTSLATRGAPLRLDWDAVTLGTRRRPHPLALTAASQETGGGTPSDEGGGAPSSSAPPSHAMVRV